MYQIDESTAVTTQPTSTALGTVGYFTDGNAATGEEATIVPAEFLNMVMLELLNAVEGAGLTPSKSAFNQLFTAIQTVSQGGAMTYAADTGGANTYKATYSPTVTAPSDGMTRAFKVKTTNTGASTFALDGSATTYPILGLGGLALTGSELSANGIAVVRFSSTLAAWVLIYCTGGASQLGSGSYLASTPAQFDSSTLAATTAFVQRALGNTAGAVVYKVASTQTVADLGKLIEVSSTTAFVLTLPPMTSAMAGAKMTFWNPNTATVTLTTQTGVFYGFGSTSSSYSLSAGQSVTAIWDGTNFILTAGSGNATLSTAGYQKLPSGLIIQWGILSIPSTGYASVTYPLAFPNAWIHGQVTVRGNSGAANAYTAQWDDGTNFASKTAATLDMRYNDAVVTGNVMWMALGY